MTSLLLVTVPCCLVIGGVFFNVGVPLAVTAYTATFAAGVANAMSPMFRQQLHVDGQRVGKPSVAQ